MTLRPMTVAVIALGVTQIIGYGTLYYAYAILVPAIAEGLSVEHTTLFGLMSAGLLAGGLAAPRLGRMMDSLGAARIMAPASLLCALLLTGVALAPNIWSFGAALLALEIIAPAVLYNAAFSTLTQIDSSRARPAITRLTLMGGFASTLFWPLTGGLLEMMDWRTIYLMYAALHLAVCVPLHFAVGRTSEKSARADKSGTSATPMPVRYPPLPQSVHSFAFWAFASSVALSGLLMAGINFHFVPILAATGLGASAYIVSMLMGPAQVLARLADAIFWQGFHPLTVALISALALPLSILALMLDGPVWVGAVLFAISFGAGQGLSSIILGTVPLALFGPKGYAQRLGRISMIRVLLSAIAPASFALVSSRFGMDIALTIIAGIGIAAALPLLLLRHKMRNTVPLPT